MPAPAQVPIRQQGRAASQELPTLGLSSSLQCGEILAGDVAPVLAFAARALSG